jgi:adenylate cyclase
MHRSGALRLRLVLFLSVGLGAAAIAFAADFGGILRSQELATIDVRFALRGSQPAGAKDLAIVQIDDVTFSDLHVRWQDFPRSYYAKVIDRLHAAGARVIPIDVQFTEPSKDPRQDNALIEAVRRAGNVVLATTEVDSKGHTSVFGGDSVVRSNHARVGNGNYWTDPGGEIRRMNYELDKLKTFSIVAAERATGKSVSPSALNGNLAWIDFVGPPGTVPAVSFSHVLEGKVDPKFFRGKIVVVGASAPSLQDVHPASTSGNELMSGAEIQANAISTALRGFPLKGVPPFLNALLILLLALVPPLASLRLPPLRSFSISVVAGVAFAAAVQFAFEHGRVVLFVYPVLALSLSAVGSVALNAVLAAFERERVRDLFARFVPEQVVNEVLAQTGGRLRLGGRQRVCTVMFTDLRGFTTFSETRSPESVIEILNHYFGEMTQAILDHGGTLVSYLGDGMMAVFGAPLEQADHADRALASAREMLEDRLPRVNDWIREQGLGEGFRMGIGLNSGEIMSGNIGSLRRLEYTIIGDPVNTASRLEGLTKGTPYPLFISDTTCALLRDGPADLIYVEELEVRGRKEKVKVWSLADLAAEAPVAAPLRAEVGLVAS